MCGRFGFEAKPGWKKRYKVSNDIDVKRRYNIAPTQESLVITRNSPNKGELKAFGIRPKWDESKLLINAKSETVGKLRTFKKMFENSRCLVPASFFFEWQKHKDGKTPYAIRLKGQDTFALAGICDEEGFVILTTRPNSLMKPIHNRMPVILTEKEEDSWLDSEVSPAKLEEFFDPYPADKMEAWIVSDLVNSPRNDSEDILDKDK